MKKLVLLACLSPLFSCHFNRDNGYLSSISTLPTFDMLLTDSLTLVHAKDIPGGKPIIMIYFSPDCPHCQLETQNLVGNIGKFKDFRIYFLTGATLENAKTYAHDFLLDRYPSTITMVKDSEHSFARIFQPKSIPFLAIYDKQKRLLKVYHGEVAINNILAVIHS